MDEIVIKGGNKIKGEVKASGAKNSALPLLTATILCGGKCELRNVPSLADTRTMLQLLSMFGAPSQTAQDIVHVDTSKIDRFRAPYELVKTMRASVLALGPLIGRYHHAEVSLPGGCAIGLRPIDQHLKAFKALGVEIEIEHGYVIAKAQKLTGAEIVFDTVTVTGTENAIMAAVLAEGTTILRNAACEPEVVDLANALNNSGAKINGAGTEVITIEGVASLKPLSCDVIGDRIEAGTLLASAAITGGEITVKGIKPEFLIAELEKLKSAGATVKTTKNSISLSAPQRLTAVNIKTHPYPGFATDMQAQFMAMMSVADGVSVIEEMVFENRFMHAIELDRMGAQISISGRVATVKGIPKLSGAQVMATDLRASASLILAGLAAENTTVVSRVYHLDRGYDRLEAKLASLGANIQRRKAKSKEE